MLRNHLQPLGMGYSAVAQPEPAEMLAPPCNSLCSQEQPRSARTQPCPPNDVQIQLYHVSVFHGVRHQSCTAETRPEARLWRRTRAGYPPQVLGSARDRTERLETIHSVEGYSQDESMAITRHLCRTNKAVGNTRLRTHQGRVAIGALTPERCTCNTTIS